jgi:hypothetical protein
MTMDNFRLSDYKGEKVNISLGEINEILDAEATIEHFSDGCVGHTSCSLLSLSSTSWGGEREKGRASAWATARELDINTKKN